MRVPAQELPDLMQDPAPDGAGARVRLSAQPPPDGILDAVPEAILCIDDAGRLVSVNREVERLFGYQREELLGRPVDALLLSGGRHAIAEAFRALNPRPRVGGRVARVVGRRSDGSDVPLEVSLSPLYTEHGLCTVAVVRAAPLATAWADRALREMLESAPDGVWVLDGPALCLTYANRGLLHQLDYAAAELLGRDIGHIAPGLDHETLRALLQPLEDGASDAVTYDVVLRRADGTGLPVEVRTHTLHLDAVREGTPRSYVSMARSVGVRVGAEAAWHTTALEQAVTDDRDRIARDLHDGVMQRIFASAMAVETLRARVSDPELDTELARIVTDLDRSNLEIRQAVYQLAAEVPEQTSLRTELMAVLDEVRAALGFAPTVRFTGDLEGTAAEWRHDLVAIFRELLSNVARHADATHVDVEVAVGDQFVLRVCDDGVGFDPARTTLGRGVRNVTRRAHAMGGSVEYLRRPGGGTVVECVVPFPSPASQPRL